ncbi:MULTISPECIES: hypothetical protein [Aeromonas]|uniref:hypothetical protein n=1 Tax=Aeromonas TaxID=642 RepID=UPI0012F150CA|nr:hypothetical protein [Aeromonas salmonicida]VXA78568.1 conserved hypothetical protein [Aeromonas salmonicida]
MNLDIIETCKYHFSSGKDYPIHLDKNYILNVDVDGVSFSLYMSIKSNSDKLIICSPGAIDATKVTPPYYHRWSWANKFPESTIVISDPTLETGRFNIGWFLGNKNQYSLVKFVNIISHIASQLNVDRANTIFYGSSAGGFSSLVMSAYLKGSKAIVQNPQIDIKKYHGSHYSELIKNNFDNNDVPIERTNVISIFEKQNYIPSIYYIQNIYDSHHFDTHFKIFLDGVTTIKKKITINSDIIFDLYSKKAQGHDADTFDVATHRLKCAFKHFYNSDFSILDKSNTF